MTKVIITSIAGISFDEIESFKINCTKEDATVEVNYVYKNHRRCLTTPIWGVNIDVKNV